MFDDAPTQLVAHGCHGSLPSPRWWLFDDAHSGQLWAIDFLTATRQPAYGYGVSDTPGPQSVPLSYAMAQPDARTHRQLRELVSLAEAYAPITRKRRNGRTARLRVCNCDEVAGGLIWREIEVAPWLTLTNLAAVLNAVFGYPEDFGVFAIGVRRYEVPDPDEYDSLSSDDLTLGEFLTKGMQFDYFQHQIRHGIEVAGYLNGCFYPPFRLTGGAGAPTDPYLPEFAVDLYNKHLFDVADRGLTEANETFYLTQPRAPAEPASAAGHSSSR